MEALIQLAIIWSSVYVAQLLAKKSRLTPVLFYLAAGCILVNLNLLPEENDPFIDGLAEMGIIVIMFALGFEECIDRFIGSVKRTWGIALFGAIAPFIAAYFVADYFWQDTRISLMFGLTMTATAVSLTMVSLKSAGLSNSRAATGIMTSAVLDDIGSLALVAILIPIVIGGAQPSVALIGMILIKAVAFFALISFIAAFIFPSHSTGWFAKVPFLGRFHIGNVLKLGQGEHVTLTVLLMAVLSGILSHYFGLHEAVGAYMAGLILKEEYFHSKEDLQSNFYEETKRIIDNIAFSWLGPVFFVGLGAELIFDLDLVLAVIPQTIALTMAVFVFQVISAAMAARYTAGFDFNESVLIGFGMLGRAELAFVVMDIAYVKHGIFTTEAFYTLMFTAFCLNVLVPVTISWWKPRLTKEPAAEET